MITDPVTLRQTMRLLATGVTVLTTAGPIGHGMTANAVTSLSLAPPLVLSCVGRAARMHRAVMASRTFAVSFLTADQEHVARHFSSRARPDGPAQFESVDWTPGGCTGAPLIAGALGWLECEVVDIHEGGDHSIFVGRALSCGRGAPGDALVFFEGSYTRAGA